MRTVYYYILFVMTIYSNFVAGKEKVLMCYYSTWATYRSELGRFNVNQINTDLCTHLVYTFAGINEEGVIVALDPLLDLPDKDGKDNFRRFNALKQKNSGLKTLLAVGGWNEGSAKYSNMAASPILRRNFVESAIKMIIEYGFDGLDVDWEYPNGRDTVLYEADVNNFTELLKELREEFDKHGLLLTAAVAPVEEMASSFYNITAISKYLDTINIMTYDMHGSWDEMTGHNSPLHESKHEQKEQANKLHTVEAALNYWLNKGCPPEKLVLGLPLYGRTFNLSNPNVNEVKAPAIGPGLAGPYTASTGVIGYNEFCVKLKNETWDVRYDENAKVPYAVQETNWVSYDDAESLVHKVKHGLKFDIAGFMVWSIETDDFNGLCHGENFPLLRAINRALGREVNVSDHSTTAENSLTISTSATATGIDTNTDKYCNTAVNHLHEEH